MSTLTANYWDALPLGPGVTVLRRDPNGLGALNKPAGVLSHPNAPGEEVRSLLHAHYDEATECYVWPREEGGEARLWLLNRLDSATSGAILVASDAALAREVKAQFLRKEVRKVYQALVFGTPPPMPQLWRDRLAVEKRGRTIRTGAAGNLPSECQYLPVKQGRGSSPVALIRLEPHTGRSHQLRVQCAKRHLPIVGDQTYGDFQANRDFARRTGSKRLFLHSLETHCEYLLAGRKFTFKAVAPLPPDFIEFL